MNKKILLALFGVLVIILGITYFSNGFDIGSTTDMRKIIGKIKHVEVRITPGNSVVLKKTEVNELKNILVDNYNSGVATHDHTKDSLATLIFVFNKKFKCRIYYYDSVKQLYFVKDWVGDEGILLDVDERLETWISEILPNF